MHPSATGGIPHPRLADILTVAVFVLVLTAGTTVRAQMSHGGDGTYVDSGKAVQFAAIPIPNYSPSFGWGLGLMATAFYKIDRGDTLCPPSSTGGFGFWTENKSTIYGLWQQVYYDEDRWRGTLVWVKPDINFQTYADPEIPIIGGNWINYVTDNNIFFVNASRVTWDNVYMGLQYFYRDSYLEFDLPDVPEEYKSRRRQYSGLGLVGSYDTRNNVFNPTRGWFVDFDVLFNRDWLGSDADYEKWSIAINDYVVVRQHDVLAWQVVSGFGTGDVPFEDQEIYGVRGIRGYADGKYRGNSQVFGQAEYRWNFWGRWGAVGFLGAGWVFDDIAKASLGDILPGIGLGARYMMIKDYRINVGVDVAWGKDDTAIYFRIGEAF